MGLKNKIKKLRLACTSLLYSTFYRRPKVLTNEETIDLILEKKSSIARYGDGEIQLMYGKGIGFQSENIELSNRLKEIAISQKEEVLICIPDVFRSKKQMRQEYENFASQFWLRSHLLFYRGYWYKSFRKKKYPNAFISRFYIDKKDKSGTKEYVGHCKKLWEGRDIVFVEGEASRLGFGNDLFDNANSIRRIICPKENAFSVYDDILKAIKENVEKEALIIAALGPTATVLAYDLSQLGYQSLDLGHIDIEYEWFLMGAMEKIPIPNKIIREANGGKAEFEELMDITYQEHIIAKIVSIS